jgi:hypothetical protein
MHHASIAVTLAKNGIRRLIAMMVCHGANCNSRVQREVGYKQDSGVCTVAARRALRCTFFFEPGN